MKFDWQFVVAMGLVAGAVWYLIRHFTKTTKGEHDCEDCGPAPKKIKKH